MHRICFAIIMWIGCAALNCTAVDLLERYPTTLKTADTANNRAREWTFGAADIFHLTRFELTVGKDLRVEAGPADLGIGHCKDGAVWAVILPRTNSWLTSTATNTTESISHVWLRFHPAKVNDIFPSATVVGAGSADLAGEIRAIAATKVLGSWHAGLRVTIPDTNIVTVDIDTTTERRRFFIVDQNVPSAKYIPQFEARFLKRPPAITRELAEKAFDDLWSGFDRQYAMFTLRPEVDWNKSRSAFRPRAIESKSTYQLVEILAEMLKPLRDLHVHLTLAGNEVSTFDRPRESNVNRTALGELIGVLQPAGKTVLWAVTPEKIGFITVSGWTDPGIPQQVDSVLEKMRDTKGLVFDVRLNGGGSETFARDVAGRFLEQEYVYASSRYRNGPEHADLGPQQARKVQPRGPWRYERPVVLLMGQRCMSSNESFISMMNGAPNVTTMGDHTCGSSGNPVVIQLPLGITVTVPRWMDLLPDGTPLDERGIEPKIKFVSQPGAFEGLRDDLLAEALNRLKSPVRSGDRESK
jgi:carboxyl-terminal processing protease